MLVLGECCEDVGSWESSPASEATQIRHCQGKGWVERLQPACSHVAPWHMLLFNIFLQSLLSLKD